MSSDDDATSSGVPAFLTGGGEMGARMRDHDWSATPLGAPDTWPQALRSAVQICLNMPIVGAVHWGTDLHILYNDAYAPVLADRHPWALGRPLGEVWAEIWDVLGPQIASVMATGRGFSTDHQLLKMRRNGRLEDTYWIYSFAPIHDEGAVVGIFSTALDATDKVLAEKRLIEVQEHQRQMLRQMPGFVGMMTGPDLVYTYVNDAYLAISERTDFVGRRFRDVFADIEGQGFFEAFENAFHSGKGIVTRGMELRLHGRDDTQYLDFVLEPIRDEAGAVTGLFVGGYETTEVYRGNQALRESEARLGFLDRLGAETAPLAEADAVLAATTRLLGEHLELSVCAYADMDENEDGFTIRGDWAAPGSTSIVGHYSLADFGKLAVENLGAGLPLVINDNLRELAPEEAATFQSIGIAATICMPLVKEGRLIALMAIHDRVPRVWTEAELSLLREVTARSWAHVERVGAAAELRASEGRFRAAVDAVQGVLWTNNAAGEMEGEQPGWAGLTGQTSDEYRGYGWAAAVHPDDAQSTVVAWNAAVAEKRPFIFEHRVRRHDGEWRHFSVRAIPVLDGAGAIREWVGVHTDVTEQRASEAALRASEAAARVDAQRVQLALAAGAIIGTWYWNIPEDRFTADEPFARAFGLDPVLCREGLPLADILETVHPDDRADLAQAIEAVTVNGGAYAHQYRVRRSDGHYCWIEANGRVDQGPDGTPLSFPGVIIDVEGRRAVERERDRALAALRALNDTLETRVIERTVELEIAHEQLRQSQKMEAMGSLTGGVAHDFNNLLAPIVGALDMLQRKGLGSERERRLIDGALQSAERAKVLVQRLLAFARRQPLQPVPVTISKLVTGMVDLIDSTLGPNIAVRVDIAPDLPPATADPNQLEMALLNLAVNARDAMPKGGELTIAASRESARYSHAAGLRPGDYVLLRVIDTGEGMDEATRQRAIEPFFSTKGIGKGTGLGLSMVHGLAAQLGGGLTIESTPGRGTAIELWLPISGAPPGPEETATAVEAGSARPSRGIALLVDDEALVRMSTADMLVDLGFTVVEAGSAKEALQLLAAGTTPAILITDHLMPGMHGADLVREARVIDPNLPVLVISGYAEEDGAAPDLPRLTKPFRNAELADRLATLLPCDRG